MTKKVQRVPLTAHPAGADYFPAPTRQANTHGKRQAQATAHTGTKGAEMRSNLYHG